MPFGIGGSRQSSSSSSSSFDNLDASSFNVGGSQQDVAFADLFQNLFGGASAAASGINTGGLAGAANNLFGAGGGFLESLSSGGAGGQFLEGQLADTGIVDEQIGLLGGDIEKFLSESILPSINQTGISANTFGGSRGEVARGIAGEGAIREFSRGATNIRASERDRTTGIAQSLLQNNTQAAGVGISGLSDVLGLAESSAFAGLSPFAALAQILGDPTVLGSSFDVGGSTQTGRAGSTSTSQSEGRSFSVSGLGG